MVYCTRSWDWILKCLFQSLHLEAVGSSARASRVGLMEDVCDERSRGSAATPADAAQHHHQPQQQPQHHVAYSHTAPSLDTTASYHASYSLPVASGGSLSTQLSSTQTSEHLAQKEDVESYLHSLDYRSNPAMFSNTISAMTGIAPHHAPAPAYHSQMTSPTNLNGYLSAATSAYAPSSRNVLSQYGATLPPAGAPSITSSSSPPPVPSMWSPMQDGGYTSQAAMTSRFMDTQGYGLGRSAQLTPYSPYMTQPDVTSAWNGYGLPPSQTYRTAFGGNKIFATLKKYLKLGYLA